MNDFAGPEGPKCGGTRTERRTGESKETFVQETQSYSPSRRTKAVGFIYFIESPDGQYLKIGFTGNPRRRFHQLAKANPERLKCIGYMPGTLWDERQYHIRFAIFRYRGEWFRFQGVLREWVAGLTLKTLRFNRDLTIRANSCPDYSNVTVMPLPISAKTAVKPPLFAVSPAIKIEYEVEKPIRLLDPAAMGRLGGAARTFKLSAERRQEIARKAAQARWNGKAKRK